jgi:hypothetical protein
MEYWQLGASGFMVPALSFGTGTFGGSGDFFKAWGTTDADGAGRLVDVCIDSGLTMFDIINKARAETRLEHFDSGVFARDFKKNCRIILWDKQEHQLPRI